MYIILKYANGHQQKTNKHNILAIYVEKNERNNHIWLHCHWPETQSGLIGDIGFGFGFLFEIM